MRRLIERLLKFLENMGHRILYIPKPKEQFTLINYGLIYSLHATNDERNLANTGWHVCTRDEYFAVIEAGIGYEPAPDVHSITDVAQYFMEGGATYWRDDLGENTIGFSARGSGYRNYTQGFTGLKGSQRLITSTYNYSGTIPCIFTISVAGSISFTRKDGFGSVASIGRGYSTRVVKDVTNLQNDGDTGIYTGNDGKIYETIRIAGSEWIKRNLAETKWRDGTTILGTNTEFTEQEWYDLTESALCAYNNDWSNV